MKYGKNSKKDKYAIHEVQMNLENISVKIRRLMKRITKKKKKHKQTNKKFEEITAKSFPNLRKTIYNSIDQETQ